VTNGEILAAASSIPDVPMQYRRLGRTGLRVSVIGLGTGGPSTLGQTSGVPEADAARLVRHALDVGVNLIDTGPDYQESEAILGRALRGIPRDRYVLCTKFKAERRVRSATGSYTMELKSAQEMIDSLERSLRRLQIDSVDLFQIHGVPADLYEPIRDRFVPVLRLLQAQGKCRFIGITDAFSDQDGRRQLVRAVSEDDFDTVMVGYNLLTPGPRDDVFPAALEHDRGVIIMCAVRRVIARPVPLRALIASLKKSGDIPSGVVPDEHPLDWLVHDGVASLPAAAYKFAADHPAVGCVLAGTANVEHFNQNVSAILGSPLCDEDQRRLLEVFGPVARKLGN
jgi:aryl-alcohol dehydrogenase-like predicted oxidoreductase